MWDSNVSPPYIPTRDSLVPSIVLSLVSSLVSFPSPIPGLVLVPWWETHFRAACFCWRMNLSDSSIFIHRMVLGVLRTPKLLTNIFLNLLILLAVFLWLSTTLFRRNSSNFWTRKLKRLTGGTFFRLRRRPRSKSARFGWPELPPCAATYLVQSHYSGVSFEINLL